MRSANSGVRTCGRAGWRRLAVAAALLYACTPVRLAAQCPDGTPPPCGRPAARAAATPGNSVAVLYFDNLSRDTSTAYVADGLTEEIVAALGKVRRLEVRSLFASQQVRGAPVTNPATLGRSLGAAYLVRGSVRPAAGRVRVTWELLRAATGSHLAGDVLDRTADELAGAPGDIAASVAAGILGPLQPAERALLQRRPTGNAEAHDMYLRALHAANSWSQQGPRAAIAFLDQAIALDPGFASAYAAKAVAKGMLADGYDAPAPAFEQVRAAAAEAVRRDSTSALGWAMLSLGETAVAYDVERVASFAQRAIALDPHLNWGHINLGMARVAQGRPVEGLTALRRGWETDTLDAVGAVALIWGFHFSGMDESLAVYLPRMRAAIDDETDRAYRGILAASRGDEATAAALLDWRYYGGFAAGLLTRALVATGRTAAARAMVDSMLAARTPGYYNAAAIAKAYVALGETDQAFAWLERALEERTYWLIWLRVDPEWEPLRTDPRFAALVARTRL
jgi:TolB-like protein